MGDRMAASSPATGRGDRELLQPARARPYLLDDDTVARIIRVHHDQAGDLDLFQNQADRWKAAPGPSTERASRRQWRSSGW